jgi:hypothetical protein
MQLNNLRINVWFKFIQNLIFNYGELAVVLTSENITINGNFMNNTEYKEYPSKVIRFYHTNHMKFRENIFTDNYKWFDFGVAQDIDCANNTIAGNGVISDLSSVEIPVPLSAGLRTAQGSGTIMELASTTNSQVVNNHIYQPGESIPGFDVYMLLAIIGLTGIVLTLIIVRKSRELT